MHIKTSDQEKLKLGLGNYTCNWGVHICGLYETEKERDEIIIGFLSQGVHDKDIQIYCPVEQSPETFKEKFQNANPECNCGADGCEDFHILSAKEMYYPDGHFSPKAMDKYLNDFFIESQKNGKRNVRATAEMVWALDAIPGVEDLMVYESRLNYFIPGKPWISICLYNVNKFSGSTIMNVLKTHPYTISGGVITQNPFFVHPDKWLAENAPEYLY
ncbi:MEDS domain-containing protein [Marinilabilia salmonicolor]|jgi:hypothetical protein|uniref:DcmR-like sensory protein n=1 Tax=Marinilabilia salmonicolor TaxID=989 RepID=A0A2T0XM03_9BACT|nr:MEDS domain-containing protein [Marinilabilia salmonicolor]PRY99955.1 DcmR-like sensory protein [Marinilabilia salmonicolor]RCW38565.1 DcmR-like sensory protein [Marinilabilia salmonicolor]